MEDIDHDADPTTYTVAIVDIEERAPKPADAGRWGESVVHLVLEEAPGGTFSSLFGVYNAGTLVIDELGAITLPVIPSVATLIEARIDTEGSAATDDLTGIVVTGSINTGTRLLLPLSPARATCSSSTPAPARSATSASPPTPTTPSQPPPTPSSSSSPPPASGRSARDGNRGWQGGWV